MVLRKSQRQITQADIAKVLGVSQATVGLVVGRTVSGRGKEKLKPETIRRVLEKAEEMGYRPHRHAQVMRQGKTLTVGMIHAGGMLQVSNERAYYAASALKERGYQLLTMDLHHQNSMDDIVEHLLGSRVDGILLACTMVQDHIAPITAQGVPLVGLSSDEIPGVPLVRCDMRDGIRKLVDHLTGQGCRRLLHLDMSSRSGGQSSRNGPWQMSSRARGFREGIKAAQGKCVTIGMDEYPAWLSGARKSQEINGAVLQFGALKRDRFNPYLPGADLAKQLMEASSEHPDAILCQNDDWAYGVINALLRGGVKVPQEVAITGFNDSTLAETFFVPITTVHQPTKAMAELAVDLLIQKINGTLKDGKAYNLPCELVVRESSLRNHQARTLSSGGTGKVRA